MQYKEEKRYKQIVLKSKSASLKYKIMSKRRKRPSQKAIEASSSSSSEKNTSPKKTSKKEPPLSKNSKTTEKTKLQKKIGQECIFRRKPAIAPSALRLRGDTNFLVVSGFNYNSLW